MGGNVNKVLSQELDKPVVKDNIWAADLAEMG